MIDDWDLGAAKRPRPDVLLLDDRGDARDSGWDVLAILQSDQETAGIPVILLTADHVAIDGHAGDLARLGVRVVLKPFDVIELIATVMTATGKTFSSTPPAPFRPEVAPWHANTPDPAR